MSPLEITVACAAILILLALAGLSFILFYWAWAIEWVDKKERER